MRISQVVAISNGEKSKKQKVLTNAYHTLSKEPIFSGLSRRYQPIEEDITGANMLPAEDQKVQTTVSDIIKEVQATLETTFNIVATQDIANCTAVADIKIDDVVVAEKIPVTHLLFLEKQLIDIYTFVNALPVLDPTETWTMDSNSGYYKSEPKETIRTKKVQRNHVLAEATDKHPAQVQVYSEDIPVGRWKTIKFSGAIKLQDKKEMLDKISKLDKAIKIAREEANAHNVTLSEIGTKVTDYIFG